MRDRVDFMRSLMTREGAWRLGKSLSFAFGAFLTLGTVSALWDNPLFTRMTPAGAIEIVLLASSCALLGVYMFIRSSSCGIRTTWLGGAANFLGVACPTCNKLLFLVFGPQILMGYYEPVRLYVGGAGAAIVALGVLQAARERSRGATDRSGPGHLQRMRPAKANSR